MVSNVQVRLLLVACFTLAAFGLAVTARKSSADETPKGKCCSPAYVEEDPPGNEQGWCAWRRGSWSGEIYCVDGEFPPGATACANINPRFQRAIRGICDSANIGQCVADASNSRLITYRVFTGCKSDGSVCNCIWYYESPRVEREETVADCINSSGTIGAGGPNVGGVAQACAVIAGDGNLPN